MDRHELKSAEDARRFYGRIDDPTARSILDFLIDHPDERFEGAALVKHLELSEHRDVARSSYAMGQIASSLDIERPWTEGQLGYLMPEQSAALLRRARSDGDQASNNR